MENLLNFSKYKNYKDSGVEWLGEIPEGWDLLPGFTAVTEKKVLNKGMKESTVLSLSYGNIVIKPEEKLTGLVPESFETYQLVEPGDIIIRCTDLQNDKVSLRTGLSKDKGIITGAYLNLNIRNGYDPRYVHFYLHSLDSSKALYKLGSGLRQNLSYSDFKRLPVFDIPESLQKRIACFLEDKNRQINSAVAKKQKQIELLKERKQFIIQNAVTKGLTPDVEMKESDIDYIGTVPKHWTVKKAKFLFDEIDKRSSTGNEELLSVSHITGVTPRSEKNVSMFMAEDYSGSKVCQKGDLVMNIMWAWMGALGVSGQTGIVSPSYAVFREKISNIFNSLFLESLLKTTKYIEHYNKVSTGLHSSRLRFYSHMFFSMKIAFPDISEQNKIVDHIRQQSKLIDSAIKIQEDQITKLKEYKTTLINNAVTGKIKVS